MTTVAVMQPTWLPWCGYLDLMDRVDEFILLDSVEFSYQSWQHRNRIRARDGLRWLTVPVAKTDRSRPIREVHVADRPDVATRLDNQLRDAYRTSANHDMLLATSELLGTVVPGRPLVEILRAGIDLLRTAFGIQTPLHAASSFDVRTGRGERLVDLVTAVGGDHYITPSGAVEYLRAELSPFRAANVRVSVHGYEHPRYRQLYEPFEPFASAIDLALCAPLDDAGSLLRSGRRPVTDLEEMQ